MMALLPRRRVLLLALLAGGCVRAQAGPPHEPGRFRDPELVELTSLDPGIKLEVRYATDPTSETTPIGAADALRGVWEAARQRLARPTPTLEQALDTFVAIYQPLFGVVQPNSRAATGVLAAFMRRNGFDPAPLLPKLLSGVSSAATERAVRARGLAEAVDPKLRAAALQAYLDEFGDEAPRWDVAAPTWRDSPPSAWTPSW